MPIQTLGRARARLALALQVGALTAALLAPTTVVAQTTPPPLTLTEAMARTAAADPASPAASARLQAARAELRQAGVRPNPTLGLELENFAGTGPYSLVDRTEATATYQQTLERGGKRAARTGVAAAELEVARLRQAVRRLDLARDVQLAYGEALAAEAELVVAEGWRIAAHRARADIVKRVRSARDPLFAGARAETLTAQADIAADRARQRTVDARAELARFWGGAPDFSLSVDGFFDVSPPPATATPDTPDLALLSATRDLAEARIRVERARQVADPTVRAGLRYFGDSSEVAFVLGGSIPLQRYDTNQAGVERALAERTAAEADLSAARIAREREVARLRARLAASASEAEAIRAEVIPAALRTVELVRDGFNRGGFQYIDVNEAERALAAARERRVAVLRQFHADQAALDRLTGRHAGLVQTHISEVR